MRPFFKKDDGYIDLAVKVMTIAAVIFAVYQYYHTIHPVWEKQSALEKATKELNEIKTNLSIQKSNLIKANTDLKNKQNQIDKLTIEYEELSKKAEAKEIKLKTDIKRARNEADIIRKKWQKEKMSLESQVRTAAKTISDKNRQMVYLYLYKFAADIFDIQIDNIRWSKGDDKLNLKKEIIKYVDSKKGSNDIETAALDIFKLFAENSVKPNEKQYSQALMVNVFAQFDPNAQKIFEELSK